MRWLLGIILDRCLTKETLARLVSEIANHAIEKYATPEKCKQACDGVDLVAEIAARIADDLRDGHLSQEEVEGTVDVIQTAICGADADFIESVKNYIKKAV